MNKELTPLQATQQIKTTICIKGGISGYELGYIDIIEQALKALEIIKEHKLLNYVLKNKKCANMYHLSEEKINLLKEVIL